jgi:nitrile hydratase subunit alpha
MGKSHPNVDEYVVSRVRALESLLLEKGLLAPDAIDRVVRRYEASTGPMIGARAVARAWLDATYRRRLLEESPAALADLGVSYDRLVVVENTPGVHNMVVCTLCSCYPWDVMGLPPTWYKMPAYRSRAVSEPRAVLAEFGLAIPHDREIRVWDSSAELRYMVLPERPPGAERMGEDALARHVTREALIGVANVRLPDELSGRSSARAVGPSSGRPVS